MEEESGLAIGVAKQGRGEREPNLKWRTSVTQLEKLRVTDGDRYCLFGEMTLSPELAASGAKLQWDTVLYRSDNARCRAAENPLLWLEWQIL